MKLFETADEMRSWSRSRHGAGATVGFVPTMGSLHEGHLRLVDRAKKEAGSVVVSIFVNPTQFGPGEDYESYPREREADLEKCRQRGVDAVYFPAVAEMYPEGYATFVEVERLSDGLCGASRPGHFRGVTTVVTKLFHAVEPDVAVFGRKDAQQARIIERMTKDLQFGVRILVEPTVREADGLAMSSRNARLRSEHRRQAPAIHRGLRESVESFQSGERKTAVLRGIFLSRLKADAPDAVLDYADVVDWETLEPVEEVSGKAMIAVAVKFGDVRLIDNEILG